MHKDNEATDQKIHAFKFTSKSRSFRGDSCKYTGGTEYGEGYWMEDLFYGQRSLCGYYQWDGPVSLHEMLDFTDIPEHLKEMTSDYKINVIEMRKLENTEVFQTDVRQVFDFIRYSEDKDRLRQLVQSDAYYQNMDEDAFDVVVLYANATELVGAKDYRRKGGKVDMCTAIREMMEDSRQEGMKTGENLLAELISRLFADNRAEDVKLAVHNEETRKRFYQEYGMID